MVSPGESVIAHTSFNAMMLPERKHQVAIFTSEELKVLSVEATEYLGKTSIECYLLQLQRANGMIVKARFPRYPDLLQLETSKCFARFRHASAAACRGDNPFLMREQATEAGMQGGH